MAFFIKRGDTGPALLKQALDASGAPINLTGAQARFRMASATGVSVIANAAAQVFVGTVPGIGPVTAADGWLLYAWSPGDTATAGQFNAEFTLTLADGSIETVPNVGYETIHIGQSL